MEFTPWIRLSLRSFCRRLFWVKIEKLILLQLSDGIKWFPTTFGPFWRGTSPRSRIIVQHPDFPKNTNLYFSAAAGRCSYVCWFRHCWRNHFYLFTPSGSHDEAAFCPQWGFWVDAVLAKTFREREIFSGNCGFSNTLKIKRLQSFQKLCVSILSEDFWNDVISIFEKHTSLPTTKNALKRSSKL